jgi:hypothetical protein
VALMRETLFYRLWGRVDAPVRSLNLESYTMRAVRCCLLALLLCAVSSRAQAAGIPVFQVNGSQDVTVWELDLTNFPLIDFVLLPSTLTVDTVVDAGNSGLAVGSTLAFAGGSLTVDYATYSGQDVPFNIPNLVTFTTSEGSFAYDSEFVNLGPTSILPDPTVSDAALMFYTQGTIHGPGGSSAANLVLFVNFDGSFGNAAWEMFSPSVIPPIVPEPSTFLLAGMGLGATMLVRRRARSASARV